MYTTLESFLDDWKYESDMTLKIFKALSEASLNQYVYDEGRTLGFIARHIVNTVHEMPRQAGLTMGTEKDEHHTDSNVNDIVRDYEEANEMLVKELRAKWNDDKTLQEEVTMYGNTWKKGNVLSALAYHQCHHRGQMTVLMRQAGLAVPGIYGPAKEEWIQYGMNPPR